MPAPDFPTGGIILGRSGARKAYLEGRGSVIIRAKTRIEEVRKDRFAIVLDEIPYQVNKAAMIEKIADLVREKKLEGISAIQDESDRVGVRVVIELKRDATPDVVLNQLWRFTPMQTSFGCNMLALNGGRPEQLMLRDFLSYFITFREEVVARRTAFELGKARDRSHILCGLAVAVANVDEVVATIRASATPADAREKLMTRRWPAHEIAPYIQLIDDPSHRMNDDGTYNLSDRQARAILDLQLQRLTQLGVKTITDELEDLAAKIKDYLDILSSRARIMSIISDELREVRELFAVPRRSEIVDWAGDMEDEDLIEREDMVVTITQGGYIKRTALAEFRSQKRGGKGLSGGALKEDDVVTTLFVANTHTPLLFFTTDGMVYKLKTWRLPLGGRTSRGKAIVNILPIPTGISIAAIMPVDAPEEDWDSLHIFFATSEGGVRRNALSDFTNVMRNGKIAMRLPDEVSLVNARICTEDDDIMLVTALGRAIRFPTTEVRVFKGRDFERRSRHPARRRRPRRVDVRHPPLRGRPGRTRRVPQAAPPHGWRGRGGIRGRRRRGSRGRGSALAAALRRDVRGREPDPDDHGKGRGQDFVQPRLSRARSWRSGRHGDGSRDAGRPACRFLPRRDGRSDHARHLDRPVDPRAGRGHLVPVPHRGRREGLRHRKGRRGRLGRLDRRGGRRGRAGRHPGGLGVYASETRDVLVAGP